MLFLFIQKLPCVLLSFLIATRRLFSIQKPLNLRNIEDQEQSKSYCLGSFGVINQKKTSGLYVVLAQFQFNLFAIAVHMGPK